ncbi:MAG: hypothetical protein PHO10_01205 [Gemmiger sp.]|nr:hypothetical protein [Gemmiger sp.]
MKRLNDLCEGRQESAILPFLWLRGEPNPVIGQELDEIEACGIREVCLESRPHPEFCGPAWWNNLDYILAEAKRRAMRVWVLDDDKFPTGHCNGALREKYPQYAKWYLAERHMDILGPCTQGAVLVQNFLQPDGRLLGILACPKPDGETTDVCLENAIDLTAQYRDGFVYFDLPAGAYRLFVLFTTQKGGGREDYMNLIDSRSVRVLLDEVYEKHYQHYAAYFGTTFAGFFSDEPELGNVKGYPFDLTLGTPNIRLPWSEELETALRTAWQENFLRFLPALWYGVGKATVPVRSQYMEELTTLVARCFTGQVLRWCQAHGVEYIGHIIEDDNAHARLGCSIGHYFREMSGQSMAGIDLVHHQIVPGFTEKIHQWIAGDSDGEFFHYGLAKLASSAAHIDPGKQGRALCELFGNYGWAEGVSLMKWLTDHMLVRGINRFTPHAFSMRYPDVDCPPHFYAQGNNPQFGCFAALMRYMARGAHLLSGGVHCADAAVLYHAEAEWAGARMAFQKPMRVLMEHQLDCDVIPADALQSAALRDGKLCLNGESYAALVLPWCEYIPPTVVDFVLDSSKKGLPTLMVDALPHADTQGNPLPPAFAAAVTLLPLKELATYWRQKLPYCLEVAGYHPQLRTFLTRQPDGLAAMFFNESTTERVVAECRLMLPGYRALTKAELWQQQLWRMPFDGTTFPLELEPGEATYYIFQPGGGQNAALPMLEQAPYTVCAVDDGWHLSKKAAGSTPWVPCADLLPGQYPNMNGPAAEPSFSGTFRYRQKVAIPPLPAKTHLFLKLEAVGDTASICVNGTPMGELAAFPGKIEITPAVKPGENEIVLEIANTLVWKLKDGASTHLQLAATGLLAAPKLLYHREKE